MIPIFIRNKREVRGARVRCQVKAQRVAALHTWQLARRTPIHAFASSGSGSLSWSDSAGRTPACFSCGDSAEAVSFIVAANKAVNNPPLRSVLRSEEHT